MADEWPKIIGRRRTRMSPWVTVIEREVQFTQDATPELYHALDQQDYIAIVALTPDERIPLVRQYRPALERFTWELPAGLVDGNEDADAACRRELLEETGLKARTVHALGAHAPCTARLSNRMHSFFATIEPPIAVATAEPGIEVKLVRLGELAGLIRSGDFVLQLHIGALMLAGMQGHLDLRAFAGPARD